MNRRVDFKTIAVVVVSLGFLLEYWHPAPVAAAGDAIEWPQISVESIAGGLINPTNVVNAGDGSNRLFVTELEGRVRVLEGGTLLAPPFLDITDRVLLLDTGQGLLGLAFPPEYGSKGYFYVDYTNLAGDSVVSRFHLLAGDPNQADPDSEEIVLTINHPFPLTRDHWGGQLAFGPKDGFLYISMGDGDAPGAAQETRSLLGKILRIDVESPAGSSSFVIPPTNPFVGLRSHRNAIWALGLRNPWRFSFDRFRGDLYLGDVGENDWEEIDFQPAASSGAENYGWDIMEGAHCFLPPTGCDQTGLTLPVWEYDHSEGCSVTGGFVYRGLTYPRMAGIYIYGDFCNGRIWGLQKVDSIWQNALLLESALALSSFGEDEAGELYLVSFGGGEVFRIVDSVTALGTTRSSAIQLRSQRIGGLNLLTALVEVRDGGGAPVSGALVEVTWTLPSGVKRSAGATTNGLGTAVLTQAGLDGAYTLDIDNITKTSYSFDWQSSLLSSTTTVP
ncbi:MAG: PQQ-dependent sugar dehydrogenase [Acidobacteriota bacterium]